MSRWGSVLLLVIALSACGRASGVDPVVAPVAGGRVGMLYKTLDEALPNVEYAHPEHGERTFSDLAVVGTITAVEKGRGWRSESVMTDYDSDDAAWRSLHMTVTVERAIGTTAEVPRQVRVALASPPADEFDEMAQGLRAMGRVVLLLRKGSPLVSYDPSLYVIVEDGGLWATVGADGALDLPFVEDGRRRTLLSKTPTLADLERAGAARRVIPTTGPRTKQARVDQP